VKKELTAVKNKIQKLKDKKALIDEELEPLLSLLGMGDNLTVKVRYRLGSRNC